MKKKFTIFFYLINLQSLFLTNITLYYLYVGQEGSVPKYVYKNADERPWDPRNDLFQYEKVTK